MFLFTESGCEDISPKTKGVFCLGEKSFYYDRTGRVVEVGMAHFRLACIINFFNRLNGTTLQFTYLKKINCSSSLFVIRVNLLHP